MSVMLTLTVMAGMTPEASGLAGVSVMLKSPGVPAAANASDDAPMAHATPLATRPALRVCRIVLAPVRHACPRNFAAGWILHLPARWYWPTGGHFYSI